jgi:hypothetical protein
VSCPAGKRAIGGGAVSTTTSFAGPFLVSSFPTTNGGGWEARWARPTQGSWTIIVYAICATVQ